MTNKPLKVVLDTNAVISILSRKLNFHNILNSLISGKFEMYVSNQILFEYEEKITHFFNKEQSSIFFQLIEILTNVNKIEIFYNLNLIKDDPTDNKFVDCAFASNADYIVTNDKHFNILKNIDFPKIKIITIIDFQKSLNQKTF